MRQDSRWTLPCLLLLILAAVGAGAEPVDEETALELEAMVDQLAESVLENDEAAVDALTCLDDLIHSRLRREEALGLVDADDPALVEERKSAARAAAYAFVERLVSKGQQVEFVDASRVEVFAAGGESEALISGAGEELEITAAGTLGVKMLALPRIVDVEACRLRDRWCLDPLSMQ